MCVSSYSVVVLDFLEGLDFADVESSGSVTINNYSDEFTLKVAVGYNVSVIIVELNILASSVV